MEDTQLKYIFIKKKLNETLHYKHLFLLFKKIGAMLCDKHAKLLFDLEDGFLKIKVNIV